MELKEGNDRYDHLTGPSMKKDQLLSFPRNRWMSLLHGSNRPDFRSSWPSNIQEKVVMQKCAKCSLKFCSPINYRRHIRVHRRLFYVNKEFLNYRHLLAAFWDQMSLVEVKEAMTFDDVMLQKISGISVINALADSLRGIEALSLPESYVNAGFSLLDVIQVKPSRFPISSQELLGILNEASENTFLCGGTAVSVEKYVFDEGTSKQILKLENLVASACFLFEQQLVKAWLAHEDAEALRCQKLLMEEEEAEQRRRAEVLQRKNQKKLRQLEQKMKEKAAVLEHAQASSKAFDHLSHSDSSLASLYVSTNPDPCSALMLSESKKLQQDTEGQLNLSCKPICSVGSQIVVRNKDRRLTNQRNSRFGGHYLYESKARSHELGMSKDRATISGRQVWAKKIKPTNCVNNVNPPALEKETPHQVEENNCELMIGSVAVRLKSPILQPQICCPNEAQQSCRTQHACQTMFKMNCSEKPTNAADSQVASPFRRPVSGCKTRTTCTVDNGHNDSEGVATFNKVDHGIKSGEGRPVSYNGTKATSTVDSCHKNSDGVSTLQKVCTSTEGYTQPLSTGDDDPAQPLSTGDDDPDPLLSDAIARHRNLPFNSALTREFLSQRWKEAISGDHVTLMISSRSEPPACSHNLLSHSKAPNGPDGQRRSILGNPGNRVDTNVVGKFRRRAENSMNMKYIPKQRTLPPRT